MDLVSKHTRTAFRELLVGWTLARIRDLFDASDVALSDHVPATVSGERRTLVEQYYATVDWTSHASVQRVLRAYEEVFSALTENRFACFVDPEQCTKEVQKLTNLLKRDGYTYVDGRIHSVSQLDLSNIEEASPLVDRLVLREHLKRIENSIEADPALAIGSAKELLETVSKQVILTSGADVDESMSVQQLAKEALKTLNLTAEAIPEANRGANSLRQVLSGLNQIVGGVAELRNLYGTGHGRARSGGLTARHARLVVGSVAALASFLLETMTERRTGLKSRARLFQN